VDGTRFDQLITRIATRRVSRLTALRRLVAGALAGVTGLSLGGDEGAAADKQAKKQRICHRSSASDPGVSKKLKKDRAKKHLKKHPFDTKGRCGAVPTTAAPTAVAPLIPVACDANTGVSEFVCGTNDQCCPTTSPVCCEDVAPYTATCWPSQYACCNQQVAGGTKACPAGTQCCAGAIDAEHVPFQQTYCVSNDADVICCPWESGGFCEADRCDGCLFVEQDIIFGAFCCSDTETNDNGGCCASYELEVESDTFAGGCCQDSGDCADLPAGGWPNNGAWTCDGRCCVPDF
jgi:hypothetical protein